MRFLSFSQPWLWSITDLPEPLAKRIENRSWQPPIECVGKRFALHAAKSWDPDGLRFIIRQGVTHAPSDKTRAASSCIVGVATIDRIVTTDRTLPEEQKRWFFGEFGWVLTDVRKLATPIPMKGAQGFRYLEASVEAEINRQLEQRAA